MECVLRNDSGVLFERKLEGSPTCYACHGVVHGLRVWDTDAV